jgi:hypothetical protein
MIQLMPEHSTFVVAHPTALLMSAFTVHSCAVLLVHTTGNKALQGSAALLSFDQQGSVATDHTKAELKHLQCIHAVDVCAVLFVDHG